MPKDIGYLFRHNGTIKVRFKTIKMKDERRITLGIVRRHL